MIESFVLRLKRIGIEVELLGNYPWVYLTKVNGIKVQGKYLSDYGFTAFFRGSTDKITDTKIVFDKIREITLTHPNLYQQNTLE